MDDFDKAVNEIEKDSPLSGENAIEWLKGAIIATGTFSQGKQINRIKKLASERPDDCQIVVDRGNYVVAHFPAKWIKISPPREVSEEQRMAMAERARQFGFKKKGE